MEDFKQQSSLHHDRHHVKKSHNTAQDGSVNPRPSSLSALHESNASIYSMGKYLHTKLPEANQKSVLDVRVHLLCKNLLRQMMFNWLLV